jgi:chitin disaccharide deacetylase
LDGKGSDVRELAAAVRHGLGSEVKEFLIVTADDFGLHPAVNEAIERAARFGILTAASLMVGAPAAADAIRRARELPDLRVGLHLVLADGRPMLPPDRIPSLVDRSGYLNDRMFTKGVRFFALPAVRRQLEAEIRAQFAAYARSGLALDHVNVHKHFHLHPTILSLLLRIGPEYGMKALRLPREPLWFARPMGWSAACGGALLAPWTLLMQRRLRAANMFCNDQIFGVAASGKMDEGTLLRILAGLPPGVSEIYLHPAVLSGSAIAASMSGYRHADELAALTSPRVRAAIAAAGLSLGGYEDARRLRGSAAAA